jgi:hypothetical protein
MRRAAIIRRAERNLTPADLSAGFDVGPAEAAIVIFAYIRGLRRVSFAGIAVSALGH